MLSLIHYFFKISILLSFFTFNTGCELLEKDKKAIDNAFSPTQPKEPEDTSEQKPNCETERYIQPQADIVKKLDLLFVVDTSGSMNSERKAIAQGIDAFVMELPSEVDLQVGVMYAHGEEKNNSGKLVGSPAILSNSNLSIDQIRTHLTSRMNNPKTENSTDGGEVGMYAFLNSIANHYQSNKTQGFYRDDAALAVVFVADENDICSLESYPAGITPVYDPEKKEWPAFHKYCEGVTPKAIVERVKQIKGSKPFLLSGIIYTGENSFPKSGENEIGYGYLETVNMANGILVDLASGKYSEGMREIGYMTYKKLNLITEFNLSQTGFEVNSLNVKVDGKEIGFHWEEALNQIQLDESDAGNEKSEILISYCFAESLPATITNLRVFGVSFTQANVSWQTDQTVRSVVKVIRLIDGFEFQITDSNLKNQHLHTILNLLDGKDYKLIVTVQNETGQESSAEIYFRTLSYDELLF